MMQGETIHGKATRRLVFICLLWGVSFPVSKALAMMVHAQTVPGADSWFSAGATMFVRFGISAIVILFMLVRHAELRGMTADEWKQGLGIGLFSSLGLLAQFDGLAHTEASTSAFLTQASVIFVPLAKAITHRAWPRRRELLCCALAVIGVAVLSDFDLQRFHMGRGEAETLISALFFTGHILWLERLSFQSNNALRVSLLMFAIVAVVSVLLLLGCQATPASVVQGFSSRASWVLMAVLIGPCTLMAFLWMNRWQRHVSATEAGLIYCLEPVFATGFAFVLPTLLARYTGVTYANESPTFTMIIGGGLVLAANLFMQWPAPRGAKSSTLNEHAV